MQVKERLYLIEDRSKAVHSNNPSGRFLLCKKGGTITKEEAKFYGIVDGYLKEGASVAEQVVEVPKPKKKRKKKKKKKTVALEGSATLVSEPVPTEPVPTEPVPTEPVPTEPVPTVEDVKSNQIVPPKVKRTGLGLIVNKLKRSDK